MALRVMQGPGDREMGASSWGVRVIPVGSNREGRMCGVLPG